MAVHHQLFAITLGLSLIIRYVAMAFTKTMKCAMTAIQKMEMDAIMIVILSQDGSAWESEVR